MSVARMKRITLFGEVRRKDLVLEWLQELGCIHLTALGPETEERHETPTYAKRNYEALRYLIDCPVKHPLLDEDYEEVNGFATPGISGFIGLKRSY